MGVLIKQSPPNFPKNEHFLPPDTHTFEIRLFYLITDTSPANQDSNHDAKDAKMILEFSHFVLQ